MSAQNQQERLNASASASAIIGGEFDPDEVLLGYQKRWIEDESELKIAEKSRRTGLTWADAADAALTAAKSRTAEGRNHFYVGSTKDMAREYIDAAAMWAQAFGLAASEIGEEVLIDEGKDILTFVIYFASGFRVQALSSNPSNLRGMQGNVTIDEAAHHDRLQELLKAALALTMWGARVRIISTHNGDEHLFNQLIQDSRAGRKRYSVHTITLDDACAEGLYRRICQVRRKTWSQALEDEWKANLLKDTATEEDALEEYYCVPKHGSGVYIPRVLIDRAANDELFVARFSMPNACMKWTEDERQKTALAFCNEILLPELEKLDLDTRHAYGQDFARSGDLSVIGVGSVEQDTRRVIRMTIELHNVPYNQQREIAFFVADNLPRLVGVAMDATGNGGYLGEAMLLRYGDSMVASIHITDLFYREWSPKYKALYESGYIEIPKDEDILQDQGKLQNIRGVPKIDKSRTVGQDGKKRHGDSAGAYLMVTRASYLEGYGDDEVVDLPPRHARTATASNDDDFDDNSNNGGCW